MSLPVSVRSCTQQTKRVSDMLRSLPYHNGCLQGCCSRQSSSPAPLRQPEHLSDTVPCNNGASVLQFFLPFSDQDAALCDANYHFSCIGALGFD